MRALLISLGLLTVIVILLFVAVQQQPAQLVYTQPTPDEQKQEEPTPVAQPEDRGEPTPKAEEQEYKEPGIEFEKVFPTEVNFWVNEILVPETNLYEGQQFIPLKDDEIKTFAGSFGPYFDDPTDHIIVKLCAQLRDYELGDTCEYIPLTYREKYVSFARGYTDEEFIGGFAAKDYLAWYEVYAGDTRVAVSNKAIVRTVRD